MSSKGITITDERMAQTVKGSLGTDLNYQPFSSWYGSVLEKMETSNEITENIFFQALEHIGAIGRCNGQIVPPLPIYESMKGVEGNPKMSWYCKKYSSVKNDYVESYGICLDGIHEFEDKYLNRILDVLHFIEREVAEEREMAEEWRKAEKEKRGRAKYKRISAQARSRVAEAKNFIIKEAFKLGDDNE